MSYITRLIKAFIFKVGNWFFEVKPAPVKKSIRFKKPRKFKK